MFNQGIIRPSISPWLSPVFVLLKKLDASDQQKWRVVIDYRKLHEVTVDDKHQLPNSSDILDQLSNSQYFSTFVVNNRELSILEVSFIFSKTST